MLLDIAERWGGKVRVVLHRPLVAGAGFLAVSQYAAAAVGFGTTVLVTRLLGPEDYGLVALAIAYPGLIWSCLAPKSVTVLTRYVARFRADGDTDRLLASVKVGVALELAAAALLVLIVGASAGWVSAAFYGRPGLGWLMVAYAWCFLPYSLLGIGQAVLSGCARFRLLGGIDLFAKVIQLAFVAVALLGGYGVAGVVLAFGLSEGLRGFAGLYAASRTLALDRIGKWWRASLGEIDPALRGEILGFLGWNYALVTLSGFAGQVPTMLLGASRTPAEAGFYRLAMSVATVASYLPTALRQVVYPSLSVGWSEARESTLLGVGRRWTFRWGVPIGLLLAVAAVSMPLVFPLAFGDSYRPAVPAVQILLMASAVCACYFWLHSFYYASGRIRAWTIGYAIHVAVTVLASPWVVYHGGFLGMAGLTGGGQAVFWGAMYARLKFSHSCRH